MQNIHELIEEETLKYLEPFKNDYIEQRFELEEAGGWYNDEIYKVEVYGFYKDDFHPEKQTIFILLRCFVNYNYKQIEISNIFLPNFMRYQGIGKKLINIVFQISEREDYKLFIVDMVPSFYLRMIKRGALPCTKCDDAVQIVRETKLV